MSISSERTSTKELIEQWLYGHSESTIKSYSHYIDKFLAHIDKPLSEVTLLDLQTWQLSLRSFAPSTQATAISIVKSLFSFGYKLGVLKVNMGKLIKLPKSKDTLAQKILIEDEVKNMINSEKNERNKAILFMLYGCGLRVSELCDLKWEDMISRSVGGQVTVFGKGQKTRNILVHPIVWQLIIPLKKNYQKKDPVFRSRQRGLNGYHLSRKQVWRIVKAAAKKVGIDAPVSPHWLRHAHASHSLDKGASTSLVQETLGHSSIVTTERYLHAKPDDSSAMYLFD